MELSKLEIQQMLREMNVKFDVEESYDSLKNRLQEENHSLWLKSVSGQLRTEGKTDKVVVRKRKKEAPQTGCRVDQMDSTAVSSKPGKSDSQSGSPSFFRDKPVHRPLRVEKPLPGKPWKEVANGTEPFNRKKRVFKSVLRRAGNSCELCGAKPGTCLESDQLQPYHLLPLDRGGEHSIKNVVALCSKCLDANEKNPDPKAIKVLKRKTRAKMYESIKVEKRKTTRGRRRTYHRR